MRLEGLGEKQHNVADFVVLLSVVNLALVTWSHLTDAVPPWQIHATMGPAVLFALASLTRRPRWAAAIRFIMGGWVIAIPYILDFAGVTATLWAYLATGSVLMALSTAALSNRRNQHDQPVSFRIAGG